MKKLLFSLLLMLLPILASAEVVEINGICYNVITKAKKAEVTRNPNSYYNYYTGKVVIPKSVTYNGVTCKVTAILDFAFQSSSNMTAVTIPASVTSIGKYAFSGCRGLTSITIPSSVTSMNEWAFKDCSGLTSATIGTDISKGAFYGCSSLASVTISSGVTSIGQYAFESCKNLTSVSIPNTVKTIGKDAFQNCISLPSITIPDSVQGIEEQAFYGCSGLKTVTIGSGVLYINYSAFEECSSLKSVTIPNNVQYILGCAFYGCSSMTSVTFGNSLKHIGYDAFRGCKNIKSVNIPNSVEEIEEEAFAECSSISSLTLGNSLTSIGAEAFSECTSLTTVNIPNSVEKIGGQAFCYCKKLTTVGIGNGVKEIDYGAFAYCEELTHVYCFAEDVPYTDYGVFEDSYIEYATLHVPAGSLDAYKAKQPWSGFMEKVKITTPKVKLNMTEASLEKDKTITLTAKFSPTYYPDQSVTWKSSDKTIATVTSAGKVKGIKAGTVTITCTSKATGAKGTCKVTVVDGGVKLDKTEAYINKGKTLTLKATVTPSTLTDKSVTWKSSNTAVATVSTAGKVKGVKAGTATITCTSKATGFSATCKVTVGYVKLDKTEAAVEKGKTLTLTPTVYPSTLTDKSVTWKSSNTKVATVSTAGKVKGIKAGTATITCTSNATGLKTTCTVTVGYVKLDKTTASVKVGKSVTLTATVYPSTLTDKSVTWKSSNTKVATVTSAGKVKGVKAGTVTITCTSTATGLSTTCKVTVTAASGARSLEGDNDDDTTGIETIETMDEDPAVTGPYDVYDLSGRKVLNQVTSLDGLPNGIYIVNGKKLLKK